MPPQTTVPPSGGERRRHQCADRREDDGGVQRLRRRASEPPAHCRAEAPGRTPARPVAGPGEGEHSPALVARHLGNDVRRRAEAVDAEAFASPAMPQAAVADQPGAQQRRRLDVAIRGEREAIALVGDGELGVAAVELVAGEAGAVAQILAAVAAIRHTPQVQPSQGTPTRSPTCEASAALALVDDGPTISWPGTSGSFGSGSSPSTTCRSVRQTAQAPTAISTCPGPGPRRRHSPRRAAAER